MLRVQQEDAIAFHMLMESYQPRLQRVLRHIVGSESAAEDLVQDVFLRVWRARKNYKPAAKFSTWVFHIAHNVASNFLRDSKRRKELQIAGGDQTNSAVLTLERLATDSTGAMPTRKLERSENQEMVQVAIEALNERQRMALLLCAFEGLSYQEIADTMDLTVQAVKSLLSRARVNLKNLLQPYLATGVPPEGSESSSSS